MADLSSLSADRIQALRDKFKDDGLERLARSEPFYYDAHGHYVPELAMLLLAERADFARRLKTAEDALEQIGAAKLLADGDFGRELRARQDIARAVLADLAAEEDE